MKIGFKTKYVVIGVFALLVGVFTLGWYLSMSRERKSSAMYESHIKDSIIAYKIVIDHLTYYVAEANQTITTQKELLKQGEITKEELRKLNLKQAGEISKLRFRIDTLLKSVGHTGQVVYINCDSTKKEPSPAILLPFEFAKKDKWLSLTGTFDTKGKLDIDLFMSVDVKVYTGLTKEKKPVCIVTSTNEYLHPINVVSYKTDAVKAKKMGIGIQAGYGMTLNEKPQLQPYIGIGVSRNIIRW